MRDEAKTKEQLFRELKTARQRIAELENSEKKIRQCCGELSAKERLYRTLVENVSDLICEIDGAGNMTYLSPNSFEITGYVAEERLGKNILENISPDDLPSIRKQFARGEETGFAKAIYRYLNRNGEWRWMETIGRKYEREAGEFRRVLITRDVTERQQSAEDLRKAYDELEKKVGERTTELRAANKSLQEEIAQRKKIEEGLRGAEKRYRDMANLLPQTIFEMDSQGRLTFVNQTAFQNFGYDEKDLARGLYALEMISSEDQGRAGENIKRALNGERVIQEYKMQRRDGSKFPGLIDASVILRRGKPAGLVGIVVDITEQKGIEAALQKSQETATQLARLNAVMAEISRLVSSTLNIEEVYPRFARMVADLIPLDRVVISLIDQDTGLITVKYISGPFLKGRAPGDTLPLQGSLHEKVARTRETLLIQPESKEELESQFPTQVTAYEDGFRSMIFTPLLYRGRIIGALILRSKKSRAYAEQHIRLAERIARHIAGAMANAQLFRKHKIAEGALKESEERFHAFMNNSPTIAWAKDEQGRYVYLNHTYEERFEIKRNDFCGKKVFDLWPADIAETMFKTDQEVLKNNRLLETFGNAPKPDGSGSKWWNFKFPFQDAAGRKYVGGIGIDVTEHMRTVEALQESEERYRLLFENSLDAIVVTDPSGPGRVLSANPAACRMFGYSEQEFLTLNRKAILGTEDPKFSSLHKMGEERGQLTSELTYKRKDGTRFPGEISSALFKDSSGNSRAVAIIRDVTERKKVEEILRQKQAEIKAMLDSLPGYAFYKDVKGKYIKVNSMLSNVFGRIEADIVGKDDFELFPPDLAKKYQEDDEKVLRTGESLLIGEEEVVDGGKRVWVTTRKVPLKDPEGKVAGIVGLAVDITARNEAQQALERYTRRLEALHQIDRAILTAHSPKDIAMASLEHIRQIQSCVRASIVLFEGVPPRATVLAVQEKENTSTHLGRGIPFFSESIHKLEQGKIDIVEDIRVLPQVPAIRSLKAIGVASFINVPLISRSGLIGALNIYLDNAAPFSPEYIEIANEVADSLAVSIEQSRLHSSILEQSKQLRALSARLQNVREEERTAIAREIHDELGQALTGLKMDLSWMTRLPRSQEALARKVESMSPLIDSIIQSVRKISSALRPGVLDDLGLSAAIEWQSREFQERTGIECELSIPQEEPRLSKILSTAVFRIFQEILTNIARHSGATQVKVTLKKEDSLLLLVVSDNGRGISQKNIRNPKSLGLLGMKERAGILGGIIEIEGRRGVGTTIHLKLPLELVSSKLAKRISPRERR